MTRPKTAKNKLDNRHLGSEHRQFQTVVVAMLPPNAAAWACAKKPALITAPRTDTIQKAAKNGNRLRRKGGREYSVPNNMDPQSATFNPCVPRTG
mmetsp:Transcript_12434/g.12028  ORF Transcript_12434/g.12028 Transcript_12434/m.12028 type:complete len:95 (-) Transcript_12434:402-686(-)